MKKIISATFLSLFIGQQALANTVITIGTDKSYPPYHDVNEDGELVGFEVDLAKEMCALAELKCEFKFQAFSTLLASVRFKKHDIAMAAFGDSVDRKRVVNFSVPYLDGGVKVYMNQDKVDAANFCKDCPEILDVEKPAHKKMLVDAMMETFKGQSVAFERNTTMDKFFENNPNLKRNIKVVYGSSPAELGKMFVSGKVAMAQGANYDEEQHKMIKKSRVRLYGGEFGYGTAIVIRKEDTELKQKLDAALKKLNENGTIKKLSEKWFEEDLSPKM